MTATAATPIARPAATPGSTAESDSASTNATCCESVAPRWPSRRNSARTSRRRAPAVSPANASSSTAAAPPTSRTRRDAVLPAERASASASSGAVMPNWRVGRRQARFGPALPGEQAVDVPDVRAARVERRRPAVAAREQAQRRQRCEAAHAGREQYRLGPDAAVGRLRREPAGAERHEGRERPAPRRRRAGCRTRPRAAATCRRSGRPRSARACTRAAAARCAGGRSGRSRSPRRA